MWNYIYCIKEELKTGFHALVKGLILKVVKKYVLGRNHDNEHYDSKKKKKISTVVYKMKYF